MQADDAQNLLSHKIPSMMIIIQIVFLSRALKWRKLIQDERNVV